MPVPVYLSYLRSYEVLEARELLKQAELEMIPHMSKGDRAKVIKRLRNVSSMDEDVSVVSFEQMVEKLNHGR